MNKSKSIFVTVLLAVLLASLDVCLFHIYPIGFAILTGMLALYGFFRCGVDFCSWLNKEPRIEEHSLDLPEFEKEPSFTCDSIIEEMTREEEGRA